MRKWQIWCEGQAGNKDFGEDFPAQLLGEVDADTFEQACDAWFADKDANTRACYRKHDGRLYFWGLQLHDNEYGARARNG